MERLGGRYQLQAEIGRGGMGAVYRAFDAALQRPVAIKFLERARVDGQPANVVLDPDEGALQDFEVFLRMAPRHPEAEAVRRAVRELEAARRDSRASGATRPAPWPGAGRPRRPMRRRAASAARRASAR